MGVLGVVAVSAAVLVELKICYYITEPFRDARATD